VSDLVKTLWGSSKGEDRPGEKMKIVEKKVKKGKMKGIGAGKTRKKRGKKNGGRRLS